MSATTVNIVARIWNEKERLNKAGWRDEDLAVFATTLTIQKLKDETNLVGGLDGIVIRFLGLPIYDLGDADGFITAYVGVRWFHDRVDSESVGGQVTLWKHVRGFIPFWSHRFGEDDPSWKFERDHLHLGHRVVFFERPYKTKRFWWWWASRMTNPWWPIVWRGGDEWGRATACFTVPGLGALIFAYGRPDPEIATQTREDARG